MTTDGGVAAPCEVLIWLPRRPEDDAKVEITLRRNAQSVDLRGLVRLRSAEHVEKMGLRFEADDVFVRVGTSNSLRPGAARLALAHIGRFRITHTQSAGEGANPDALEGFRLVISSLSYGGQRATPSSHYLGHRNLTFHGEPKSLRFCLPEGVHAFELQRHWTWRSLDNGNSVQATSVPVLVLTTSPSALTLTQVDNLMQLGEDACTLLSLAARHRVVPHIIRYSGADFRFEEWRNPLCRQRGVTEEDATGPLVDQADLEVYFERSASWWIGLNPDQKDAVRLAIFGINRLTESTMESDFMGKFSALEGLAKRWGTGGTAREKFDFLLKKYPLHIGGLWPLFESDGGVSLYWLRNEIAHGRTVTRLSGALSIATDHLQLWLEHTLLALIGFTRVHSNLDWLSAQVPLQNSDVATLRRELHVQSKGAKKSSNQGS
ncbi:hypothetical protein [Hydrogenophaga taeniospiralis]|uniref:hypothetical protein n=1 Tax=Hydrogenophaga taeniospiralis TaxID=65656 RepID=UPI0012F7E485|nr:hypothetical protein [Hydrogenophaga taeniospiralis]